ncbi:MAG: hypothetical protein ACLP8B_19735, partial [Xanthobacteraceae bacterium]
VARRIAASLDLTATACGISDDPPRAAPEAGVPRARMLPRKRPTAQAEPLNRPGGTALPEGNAGANFLIGREVAIVTRQGNEECRGCGQLFGSRRPTKRRSAWRSTDL